MVVMGLLRFFFLCIEWSVNKVCYRVFPLVLQVLSGCLIRCVTGCLIECFTGCVMF